MSPTKKPSKEEVCDVIGDVDAITCHKDGSFTVKRGYFYRNLARHDEMKAKIENIPGARIIDEGDHWHAFVGGAKPGSRLDSYIWFRVVFDEPISTGQYGLRWQVWGRNDRLLTKEKVFTTKLARARFMDKLEEKDNFQQFVSTYDEPVVV